MNKQKLPAAKLFSYIVLGAFALVLILPPMFRWFMKASADVPYIMGFIKFALLATVGEIIALYVDSKRWQWPKGFFPKMIVWGLLGMVITLSFQIFGNGVAGAMQNGYLPGAGSKFLTALFSSLFMNALFAPTFMSFHRITDTMINARADGKHLTFMEAVACVDWRGFVSFVLLKTLPLFWVPAHTVSFLLPAQFRIIFAAALSIVLGVILVMAKRRK